MLLILKKESLILWKNLKTKTQSEKEPIINEKWNETEN